MSLRLFAAAPIPEEIAGRLLALEADVPGASWREAEQFHLTLCFFGEIDEALARDLDCELASIVAAPFEIRLAGAGSFGGRAPSALWAGVQAPPALSRLAGACERAALRVGLPSQNRKLQNRKLQGRKLQGRKLQGRKLQGRKFKPHVTLAYCHGTSEREAADFQAFAASFRTDTFWIDRFFMFSSRHSRQGARYEIEAEYPLTGIP